MDGDREAGGPVTVDGIEERKRVVWGGDDGRVGTVCGEDSGYVY